MDAKTQMIWALLVLAVCCCVKETAAKGYFDIKLISYSHSCREDLSTSKCDPFFTFCVSRPSKTPAFRRSFCNYAYDTTDHFQDDSYINFQTIANKRGAPVPWVFHFNDVGNVVMFSVKVMDHDSGFLFSDHDHMVSMFLNMTVTIYPSKDVAAFKRYTLKRGDHTLIYDMRLYCDTKYYGPKCKTYCSPRDDNAGHYDCNPITGKKLCHRGWKGEYCNQDINECDLGYCFKGTCENLPGDYKCLCPVFYSGKNCSIDRNPCTLADCQNGATCLLNPNDLSTTCLCADGWHGEACEIQEINPCLSNPCLNGGNCIFSANNTNFTCGCTEMYSGEFCNDTVAVSVNSTHTTVDPFANMTFISPTDSIDMGNTTSASNNNSEITPPPRSPATTMSVFKIPTTTEGSEDTTGAVFDSGQVGQSKAKNNNTASFQLWHGLILLIAILAMIVVIIFMFVRRWKSRKTMYATDSLPPPAPVVVVYDQTNGHLAFENNMYHETNRSNIAREENQIHQQHSTLPPTTPFDDELFYPTKPANSDFEVENETTEPAGAEGCAYDNNSFAKEKTKEDSKLDSTDKKSAAVAGLNRASTERAESNPYQDFSTLTRKRDKNEETKTPASFCDDVFDDEDEEDHYQDLDEMAMGAAERPPVLSLSSNERSSPPFVPPPRIPTILPLDSPPATPPRSSARKVDTQESQYEEPSDDTQSNIYAEINKSRVSMDIDPKRGGSYIWTDGQDTGFRNSDGSAYDIPRSDTLSSPAISIYDSPRTSGMARQVSSTDGEYSSPSSLPVNPVATTPTKYEATSELWTSNPPNHREPSEITITPGKTSPEHVLGLDDVILLNNDDIITGRNVSDDYVDSDTSDDGDEPEDIKHLKQEVLNNLDFVLLDQTIADSNI